MADQTATISTIESRLRQWELSAGRNDVDVRVALERTSNRLGALEYQLATATSGAGGWLDRLGVGPAARIRRQMAMVQAERRQWAERRASLDRSAALADADRRSLVQHRENLAAWLRVRTERTVARAEAWSTWQATTDTVAARYGEAVGGRPLAVPADQLSYWRRCCQLLGQEPRNLLGSSDLTALPELAEVIRLRHRVAADRADRVQAAQALTTARISFEQRLSDERRITETDVARVTAALAAAEAAVVRYGSALAEAGQRCDQAYEAYEGVTGRWLTTNVDVDTELATVDRERTWLQPAAARRRRPGRSGPGNGRPGADMVAAAPRPAGPVGAADRGSVHGRPGRGHPEVLRPRNEPGMRDDEGNRQPRQWAGSGHRLRHADRR
ncbi:hypothetical protein ACQP1S_06295 [Micromonospora matsumotoense]|uniref:hypothetical protein n=1 Tax=Micromonospora matsumotoense TaxID=121616 RepID=UPI003D906DFC